MSEEEKQKELWHVHKTGIESPLFHVEYITLDTLKESDKYYRDEMYDTLICKDLIGEFYFTNRDDAKRRLRSLATEKLNGMRKKIKDEYNRSRDYLEGLG